MIDFAKVVQLFIDLLPQLPVTLLLTILSLLGGLVLGLVLALVRIYRVPVLSQLVVVYVSFMRSTPMLVQLFLIFYGLPKIIQVITGYDIQYWSSLTFSVLAFSLHCAAAMSEVYRSAYLAVPKAQLEAGYAVGMTYFQTLRRILLPQMMRVALPNIGNHSITLFKESTIAFTIGLVDVMGQAQILIERSYGIFLLETYLAVSVIYWFCSMLMGRFVAYMNARYAKRYKIMAGKA
ncbi:amino acid ABC transporter permease [Paenibacillus thalictri]|uniref:Amino acid ABC transporter permease n=1 Tax=Paenibacillus thalictri TaxID=2527873 RepID=A0A4Q9DJ81_9BACL|nr:amino acid ABC transporter permease [Paenibacillus thalictri]TBL70908.1 amino acid ABC transporter permease [Paenibacillus thalictri]